MYNMALEMNSNDAGALFFKSRVHGSWGDDVPYIDDQVTID